MTAEDQRIAIAEACPKVAKWPTTLDPEDTSELWFWQDDNGDWHECVCNDPIQDLNAMHSAEKVLTYEQCQNYHALLDTIQAGDTNERNGEADCNAQDFWFHATAAQRAEAFLLAKGKWTE